MLFFDIDNRLKNLSDKALVNCKPAFKAIENSTEYNQQKVLSAFIEKGVSESHFASTTGYGYGDRGRDLLDEVFAKAMGCQDALVRHSIVSGTHAIALALFGILRPNDTMLAIAGKPYDTLHSVIGKLGDDTGSLADWGVKYKEVALDKNNRLDTEKILQKVKKYKPKLIHIQRSRGYSIRPSLKVSEINKITQKIKEFDKDCVVFVDNCYGEFVETNEPTVDLMAGSLIKNPGGGIADNGGYICGKSKYVELCANRMTAPGLGRDVGASLNHNRNLFMGLFQSPHVVGEALKTAAFCSSLFKLLGYSVSPEPNEERTDIIQSITLEDTESLIAFCQGMQKGAPVDSYVTPIPSDMPGYDNQVIMAAGAFTMGASIELSADAPIREPYAAYMQGGLNFYSGKIGILMAAQSMLQQGLLNI